MSIVEKLYKHNKKNYDEIKNIFEKYKLYQIYTDGKIKQEIKIKKNTTKRTKPSTTDGTSIPEESSTPSNKKTRLQKGFKVKERYSNPVTTDMVSRTVDTPYRDKLVKNMRENDDIEGENEKDDEEYINYNDKENGKIIEIWLSDNMKCPVCKNKTLRRYVNNSMPVIDIMCINKDHVGVRYWQVKTSTGYKIGFLDNNKYFNIDNKTNNNYIYVGSRNYGEVVHDIIPSNPDKKLLIGYILIIYTDIDNIINIDINKSYIIMPIIDKIESKYEDYYYKYLSDDKSKKHKITFNPMTNSITSIKDSKVLEIDIVRAIRKNKNSEVSRDNKVVTNFDKSYNKNYNIITNPYDTTNREKEPVKLVF